LLLEADFLPVAQPFFGAGAGYARIADDNSSDGTFAYQGMGGLSFDIVDNVDIVAEYKYLRANNVEFGDSGSKGKFDYIDQNVELGVRFGL
jgi:opacity protein-like surface antigen